MENDVTKKLEREDPDKYYLEFHAEQDITEMNKIAEDEIATRAQPIEDEEPPTEEDK